MSDTSSYKSDAFVVFHTVRKCFRPLAFTHEFSEKGVVSFLDVRLFLYESHPCWMYYPRSNKPLLPFYFTCSKLIKRDIVSSCFITSLGKSCEHKMNDSFREQSERLTTAGYQTLVQGSAAEGLLRRSLSVVNVSPDGLTQDTQNFAGIPYMHRIARNLKKVTQCGNVKVVFSAPEKLRNLCKISSRTS